MATSRQSRKTRANRLSRVNLHPLKQNAALYGAGLGHLAISGACTAFEKLSKNSKVIATVGSLVPLMNIAVIKCADLSTHWRAIALDPPNPNFTQFAELGPLDYNFDTVNTPLERATRTLAHALSEQAAASKALLTSLERFQGAQQADNDEYMILQLEEMNKLINLLMGPGGSMLRAYAALEAFDVALRDDPLGSEQEAQDLRAAIPGMRRGIGGLLGPLTNTFIRVKSGGVDVVVPSGLQGWIIVYLGRDPFLPGLGLPGIPQVRAANGLPPIVFQHPTASSSGPYIAPPNTSVPLDAASSTDPNGDTLTFAWDFDGDGNFNDSSDPSVPLPFAEPGTRLAGLKVTDSSGNSDVLYVLVKIGDINTQDVIGFARVAADGRSSEDLQHITANGTVNLLSPGIGPISNLPRALHVDFGGDIFILDETMLRHFDSAGNHIKTLSPQQVGNLLGFPVHGFGFKDFVIDGRGDLIVSLVEDLGPGCLLITGVSQTCIPHVGGLDKLVRLARDGSRASVLTDIHQHYLTKQNVNGQLILEVPGTSINESGGDIALSKDPQGNVIVADANNLFPLTSGRGIWQVDPNTGAVTNVLPSGQLRSGFGPFVVYRPAFGGVQISAAGHIGPHRGTGGIEVDSRGDYILGNSQNSLKLARMFVPPQITAITSEINLVEVFPAYFTTSGVIDVPNWPDFAIDRGGDYLFGGGDFLAGPQTSGLYRVTPIGEIFKVANIATPPQFLDVVPEVREVTPKDLPPPPRVRLENLTISQQGCPGGAQAGIMVNNPGTADLTEPLRVYFFDGDPTAGGVVFGSAIAPSIAAGASVNLTAPWPNPGPGVHQVFAMALGATNLAFKAFMVCVPTLPAGSDGLELFPASATTSLGSSHTLTAELEGLFGAPVSGAPIQFTVTGANTASGTATTDANGVATFTYSATNPGLDMIVATFAGGQSGPATNDWFGAPTDTIPPVLTLPANITVEAASGSGGPVNFTATANDNTDGSVPVTCSPASSSTFAFGTTTVNCSASDAAGNHATGSFTVTVVDTTPPTLTLPANITANATLDVGAVVNFTAAANDNVDGSVPVTCAPLSGTTFALGTTAVNCSASDSKGNTVSASFTITVHPPEPSLDHFLGYKTLPQQGSQCRSDAPQRKGKACEVEEQCGGDEDEDELESEHCVPKGFPLDLRVSLADAFESQRFDVKKPLSLYNPADKNSEGVHDPETHLRGYRIKQSPTQPPQPEHVKHKLRVENQFGEIVVTTIKPERLLVPTAKSLTGPLPAPDPEAHDLDHFKCYKTQIAEGVPKFSKDLQALAVDQFSQAKRYDIKKPKRVCLPVDKNGEGIKHPDNRLMCYRIKPAPHEPQHVRVRDVHLNNQFGPERIHTVRDDELCVPSEITDLGIVTDQDGGPEEDDE